MIKLTTSISLLPLFLSVNAQETKKTEEKYNIPWLSCEDMDPIHSCYGARGVNTPNIDRLAREGILFSHAYATVAVCGVDLLITDSNGRQELKAARHFFPGINLWEQNLNNFLIAGVYNLSLLAEGKQISNKLCVVVPEP